MREVSDKLRNFSRLSTASEDEALEGFDPEEVKRSLSARYPLSSGKSRTVSSGTSGGYGPSSASASASFRVTYSNPVMVGIPSPYTVTAPEVKPPPRKLLFRHWGLPIQWKCRLKLCLLPTISLLVFPDRTKECRDQMNWVHQWYLHKLEKPGVRV